MASRSPLSLNKTSTATPPTNDDLTTALTSSTRPFQDTRRDMPLSGFRRPRSGCRAFGEKFQLPRKNGDSSAARISAANKGANESKASSEISARRTSISVGSVANPWSRIRPRRNMAATRCSNHGPISQNAAAPTIRTRKVPTSRERGTCPSSRACSRRRADAASVFSRSLSSAISSFQWSRGYYRKKTLINRDV